MCVWQRLLCCKIFNEGAVTATQFGTLADINSIFPIIRISPHRGFIFSVLVEKYIQLWYDIEKIGLTNLYYYVF